MRSLGTIRTRVERLSGSLPSPTPLIIHEQFRYERCPACGAELDAHAQATALAAAVAGQRPDDPPPAVVWYSTDALTTCPRCGAPLPPDPPPRRRGA
jgi:hypothetical protein